MMKRFGTGIREDINAASPVVGSILLAAIVVVTVSAIASPLILSTFQEASPNGSFEIEFDGKDVTVTYWNGDTLDASEVTILHDDVEAESQFSGTLEPGDKVTFEASVDETVRIVWQSSNGSQSKIFEETVLEEQPGAPIPEPSPTPTPSEPTPTPTPTPTGPGEFEELSATVDVNERNNQPNRLRSVEFAYDVSSESTIDFEVLGSDGVSVASESETGSEGTIEVSISGQPEDLPVTLRASIEDGECLQIEIPEDTEDGATFDLYENGEECSS